MFFVLYITLTISIIALTVLSPKIRILNSAACLNVQAWRLWEEDRPMGMVDQTIVEFCNKSEVLKCIIIGLLCVQEDPGDRPTMSNIVFMLGSEIENLPRPKQPAFVARTNQQILSNSELTNEVTLSTVKGR